MTPQELLAACSPNVVAVTSDGDEETMLWVVMPKSVRIGQSYLFFFVGPQLDKYMDLYTVLPQCIPVDWGDLPPERRIVTRADLENHE
jgi:hypothetical protein